MLDHYQFIPFVKGEIKPEGWLKQQLIIQAKGLSGNLDRVWPDVSRSQWIGGDKEGWERVPYWLDGFIPLAYLLDDEDLIQRAQIYIDAIIDQQEDDGWICPCTFEERRSYDIWSGFLIAKVLVMYADLSADTRIEEVIYKYFKNLEDFTKRVTLNNWALYRWFEVLIPLFWLYIRRPEPWLKRLIYRLEQQGFAYEKLFDPYMDGEPKREWTYDTHVVNLAMALKQSALVSQYRDQNPEHLANQMIDSLFNYHGMAMGHFTGDECVHGISPIQGTELCGVVEAMYSYEILLAVSGNAKWGDYLERLALNGLPATISEDMWTHQYDQQTNQIRCAKQDENNVIWGTNGPESNMFGLEPNFGCCTANFNQGWPKLAMSTFMQSESGIVSTVLLPSKLKTKIRGIDVTIELITDYPFKSQLKYVIETKEPIDFELLIRVPEWAKQFRVNDEKRRPENGYVSMKNTWEGKTEISIHMNFEPQFVERPNDMHCLWHGPLLYSVGIVEKWNKIEYTRDGVERKYPYCDYEVHPESSWAYGFRKGTDIVIKEHDVSEVPFSALHPPIELEIDMYPLLWREIHGVAAIEPDSRSPQGEPERIDLVPYGCARLRMTEVPIISE